MSIASDGLRRLESILGDHVARGSIPGLVALVSQGGRRTSSSMDECRSTARSRCAETPSSALPR